MIGTTVAGASDVAIKVGDLASKPFTLAFNHFGAAGWTDGLLGGAEARFNSLAIQYSVAHIFTQRNNDGL